MFKHAQYNAIQWNIYCNLKLQALNANINTISNYALGAGLGSSPVTQAFKHHNPRQVNLAN